MTSWFFMASFLCFSALLITLDNSNAAPVIDNFDCNIASLELSECASVVANPTEGNPLYSHSELFGATATPKDVEAFKYYCINDLMTTIIHEQLVSHFCVLVYLSIISSLQEAASSPPLNNMPSQQNYDGFSDLELESLRHTLEENIAVTCQYYSTLKAYQHMLYQFLHSQDTNVSNATTTSVMYLLQTAAESLQTISVSFIC